MWAETFPEIVAVEQEPHEKDSPTAQPPAKRAKADGNAAAAMYVSPYGTLEEFDEAQDQKRAEWTAQLQAKLGPGKAAAILGAVAKR